MNSESVIDCPSLREGWKFHPFATLLLALLVLIGAPRPAHALITNGENAIDVLGQFDSNTMADSPADYVKGCLNDGASPFGFYTPGGFAIDATNHWLFVSETFNNRVLVFTLTGGNVISSKTPTYVLGQTDFAGCMPNQTNTTTPGQSTLWDPVGLAVDSANQLLYVMDSTNNRVMIFSYASGFSNGMNASYELGQAAGGGAFTTSTAEFGQAGFNGGQFLALDTADKLLYEADENNNRVMVFPSYGAVGFGNGENATYVIGQTGFGAYGAATTATGMSAPTDLAYDATNQRLFVGDSGNNRVLVFSVIPGSTLATGETASYELGQASGGTAFTTATAATTVSGLSAPAGLDYDSANTRLFVADGQNAAKTAGTNNRVMVFNVAPSGGSMIANGENASYELGQASGGSAFTTATAATTQSGLNEPAGVTYDSTNSYLYVADYNNNRAMIFNVATGTIANGENATDLLGQYNSPISTATISWTQNGPNNGPNGLGFNEPADLAVDTVNQRLFVCDTYNNRVLVYNLNPDNSISTSSGGHTAVYVLGQSSLQGSNAAPNPPTQASMNNPTALAYDGVNNRLFVADTGNNRILVFNTSSITNGMNANTTSGLLGQANFVSGIENEGNYGTASQSSLSIPSALAYDSANTRLFVADYNNNRVMVFSVPTNFTNNENAITTGGVVGQTNFTNNTAGTTSRVILGPQGIAYDAVKQRLFVAEEDANDRVTVFSVAPGFANGPTATNVIGQTSFTATGAGLTAAKLDQPKNMSYDATNGRLFVADSYNQRVLVFNAASGVLAANNAKAVYEIGWPSGASAFTTNDGGAPKTTQSSLALDTENNAEDCAQYDPATGRLFVCDTSNNRVMIFDASYLGTGFFIPGYD